MCVCVCGGVFDKHSVIIVLYIYIYIYIYIYVYIYIGNNVFEIPILLGYFLKSST